MKVVYFGSSSFAAPPLDAIREHVAMVVSQPDKPSGRGMEMRPTPVKALAQQLGLPVMTPRRCKAPGFSAELRDVDADLFVVASYGQILPTSLLEMPKHGCVNIHASMLPKYRGAAPIQRAIEAGETFTGVTLMHMDEGMDTGDIIVSELMGISPDETAGELHDRMAAVGARLLEAWLPVLADGTAERRPQDHERATYAPKVEKEDARLDLCSPIHEAYNRFRAFTPFPGAFIETGRGPLKVLEARMIAGVDHAPGCIVATKPSLVVACENGALNLLRVQAHGKRATSGADYANGARLKPGDPLR